MRSHAERVAAVRRRIAEEEQKKRLRHSRMMTACCAAACLVLIAGLSVLMPGIVSDLPAGSYPDYEMTASMFGGGAFIGYIVIGLISFLLGICVTILCFRIRGLQKEGGRKEADDGGDD